jgi:hypothetical protein
MIANVHETRVFECDMQNFFSTISPDVEPAEFGMNFDGCKVNNAKNSSPKDRAFFCPERGCFS